jgi:ring-1,2-phenylacetyl-CoA epoxidase subunit PaaE
MAIHFHSLAIKKITQQTTGCVTLTFAIPEALAPEFNFIQGQNLTLKTNIDGAEIRRSYSICSAPHEQELTVAVKKVTGGIFSTYVNDFLEEGMTIDILPPTGNFYTPLKKENKKSYVAFAAGSGITPIISIIKTTLITEPESNFTLVYSNKSFSSIIFLEELEGLKNKYVNRFNLINLLSRENADAAIFNGRIDKEKLASLAKLIRYASIDDFFICGPYEMIFCVKDFLVQQGIAEGHIHFELFTSPGQKQYNPTIEADFISSEKTSKVSIMADGRSLTFDVNYTGNSILVEALKYGADLPFACKAGVCCTCKARLVSGKVRMDVNWGLEKEEIEKGFILTCQSHPITDEVAIDFDDK